MRDQQLSAPPGASHSQRLFPRLLPLLACFVLTLTILGVTGSSTTIWDGGYPYVACEFTFVDTDGNPVSGVKLEVKNEFGVVRHHWPIDDFYIGRVPTSDHHGKLKFHCCGHRFGGTCHTYFYVIKTGGCGAPKYMCNFLRNGQTVASVPFNDLAFGPDSKTARQVRMICVPTPEQVYGGGTIPAVDDLPERSNEFIIVSRSIALPN